LSVTFENKQVDRTIIITVRAVAGIFEAIILKT
jgi:hypothetical protein